MTEFTTEVVSVKALTMRSGPLKSRASEQGLGQAQPHLLHCPPLGPARSEARPLGSEAHGIFKQFYLSGPAKT